MRDSLTLGGQKYHRPTLTNLLAQISINDKCYRLRCYPITISRREKIHRQLHRGLLQVDLAHDKRLGAQARQDVYCGREGPYGFELVSPQFSMSLDLDRSLMDCITIQIRMRTGGLSLSKGPLEI